MRREGCGGLEFCPLVVYESPIIALSIIMTYNNSISPLDVLPCTVPLC